MSVNFDVIHKRESEASIKNVLNNIRTHKTFIKNFESLDASIFLNV